MSDRRVMTALLLPLLAVTIGLGSAVYRTTSERTSIKKDASTVNSIQYGLLSVDLWKDRISEIVSGDMGDFALSPGQENDLKKVIANVLQALITETDGLLHKRRKTLSEKIQKIIINSFIDMSDIRKRVPALTQSIIDEMKKPSNSRKLKHLAQTQLDKYAALSYDNNRDPGPLNRILVKYQTTSPEEFNTKTEGMIRSLEHQAAVYNYAMLGSAALFLGVWWSVRKDSSLQKLLYTFAAAFAFVFLITAVTTPMMEIDARINKVDILLVGKHLVFQDQVLFYRSKSILQVVKTMLDAGGADSTLVGLLILTFSILFPIMKLISSEGVLLGGDKIRKNPWTHFFAFKSGKWSMADVMVIAIFMAYLGFDGILNNQLQSLNIKTDTLECISTSGTTLQPGFILFVAFVIFGMFLSFILERIVLEDDHVR